MPGFVFDWLKQSSATGFLRFGPEPNLRVQDGFKQELLCESCETKLSVWEKPAAEEVFKPYHHDTSVRMDYGPWLAKFSASVVWRVLVVFRELGLGSLSEEQYQRVDRALQVWREFIFDQRPHPGEFELHVLPVDVLSTSTRADLPSNMNRYLARAVEMDIPATRRRAVVYVKMCKLILVGFIQPGGSREWQGTRLSIKHGVIKPGHYVVPTQFLEYVAERAARMRELMRGLSDRQREKTTAAIEQNLDRAAQKLNRTGNVGERMT